MCPSRAVLGPERFYVPADRDCLQGREQSVRPYTRRACASLYPHQPQPRCGAISLGSWGLLVEYAALACGGAGVRRWSLCGTVASPRTIWHANGTTRSLRCGLG